MTSESSVESEALVAAGYDSFYAGAMRSSLLRDIWQEHASGADYPPEFANISFVTVAELGALASALRLSPQEQLVDLACGAGGPGLWIARETHARLTGIDLSAKGVAAATSRAQELGLHEMSKFRVGSFAKTGLDDVSVDAAMTVDALQYAPDKAAAFAEAARIVRPGGRFVLTTFETDPDRVAGLPVLGDDPVADYGPGLQKAGFAVESYVETPDWWKRMAASYGAVLEASSALTVEMGSDAVAALESEMALTLEIQPYVRRVFVVATRS